MYARALALCASLFPLVGGAAPVPAFTPSSMRPSAQTQPARSLVGDELKVIRTQLTDLNNEIKNHEHEIRSFEKKLLGHETSMDHFQQELADDLQVQKDFTRATFVDLQTKSEATQKHLTEIDDQLSRLTQLSNSLTNDLRTFKAQSNEAVQILDLYKQKIGELEGKIAAQNSHIANLESALQSVMELFQTKEGISSTESTALYVVQPGDNLEKIARKHGTTVKEIQIRNPELNGTLIRPGQKIKIP